MPRTPIVTLDEIKAIGKATLTPADIAQYLGVKPQGIRAQAKHNPAALGFPVSVVESRTLIPKDGFIAWAEGRGGTHNAELVDRLLDEVRQGITALLLEASAEKQEDDAA